MANNRKRFHKMKAITLGQQMVSLNLMYGDGTCCIKKGGRLVWEGRIHPTMISQEYNATLTYKLGEHPQVWISGGELQKLDAHISPHIFHVDVEKKRVHLRLYRDHEFDRYKILANTIIPWAIEWLFFYELWLATGKWFGGGEHPKITRPKEN